LLSRLIPDLIQLFLFCYALPRPVHSFPTRRSSDLNQNVMLEGTILKASMVVSGKDCDEQASVDEVAESTLMCLKSSVPAIHHRRSEEHTSELQSRENLVCRLLLEKKKIGKIESKLT